MSTHVHDHANLVVLVLRRVNRAACLIGLCGAAQAADTNATAPIPPVAASGVATATAAASGPTALTTLNVQVFGGAESQPIIGAHVLVREEAGALLTESRTNRHGIAVIDRVPAARLKLQVIASTDWATQGLVVDVAGLKAPPTVRFDLSRAQTPGGRAP